MFNLTPYTAFAWSTPSSPLKHIVPTYWINKDDALDDNPADVAKFLLTYPSGSRAAFMWHAADYIVGHPKDFIGNPPIQSPWLDNGAASLVTKLEPLIAGIKAAGATIDYFITDAEFGFSMWAINEATAMTIAADPRFAAITAQFGAIDASQVLNFWNWPNCTAWNDGLGTTTGSYFKEAYYNTLIKYFPNAGASEYGSILVTPTNAQYFVDLNGWTTQSSSICGSHQSPVFYNQVAQITNRNPGVDFTQPLPVLIYQIDDIRACLKTAPQIPWVACKSWTDGSAKNVNTPYWEELIWHLCLSGSTTNFLYWNVTGLDADHIAMDNALETLSEQTGISSTLTSLLNNNVLFNSPMLVSGASCENGSSVFRISVNSSSADQSVSFTLPGQSTATTVTIPAGESGIWYIIPGDQPAIITTLRGTIIGTPGSWNNSGNTITKVFDGNPSTFFDGIQSNGCWVGLDLGAEHIIVQISYSPRSGFAGRMLNGIFQGANSSDFSDAVLLSEITKSPTKNMSVPVTNTTPFRYVRYLSPDKSHGNVAEIAFMGR